MRRSAVVCLCRSQRDGPLPSRIAEQDGKLQKRLGAEGIGPFPVLCAQHAPHVRIRVATTTLEVGSSLSPDPRITQAPLSEPPTPFATHCGRTTRYRLLSHLRLRERHPTAQTESRCRPGLLPSCHPLRYPLPLYIPWFVNGYLLMFRDSFLSVVWSVGHLRAGTLAGSAFSRRRPCRLAGAPRPCGGWINTSRSRNREHPMPPAFGMRRMTSSASDPSSALCCWLGTNWFQIRHYLCGRHGPALRLC
jgi:hypothetical protein